MFGFARPRTYVHMRIRIRQVPPTPGSDCDTAYAVQFDQRSGAGHDRVRRSGKAASRAPHTHAISCRTTSARRASAEEDRRRSLWTAVRQPQFGDSGAQSARSAATTSSIEWTIAAARLDRAGDEEVQAAADDVLLPAALEPEVGRDRNDAAVVLAAASHELGEHPDLACCAVVDHRPVEPCDECVGRTKPFCVDPIDLLDRDVGELAEVLVRDEAVEALVTQPRGEQVEPRALGFGEERSGDVRGARRRTLPARTGKRRDQRPVGGERTRLRAEVEHGARPAGVVVRDHDPRMPTEECRHPAHELRVVDTPEPPLPDRERFPRVRAIERVGGPPCGLAPDVVEIVSDDVDVRVARVVRRGRVARADRERRTPGGSRSR